MIEAIFTWVLLLAMTVFWRGRGGDNVVMYMCVRVCACACVRACVRGLAHAVLTRGGVGLMGIA